MIKNNNKEFSRKHSNNDDMFFSVTSIDMNTFNLERKLYFFDKDNAEHSFFKYLDDKKMEIKHIILENNEVEITYRKLNEFWKKNKEAFKIASKIFIEEIYESIFKECLLDND